MRAAAAAAVANIVLYHCSLARGVELLPIAAEMVEIEPRKIPVSEERSLQRRRLDRSGRRLPVPGRGRFVLYQNLLKKVDSM